MPEEVADRFLMFLGEVAILEKEDSETNPAENNFAVVLNQVITTTREKFFSLTGRELPIDSLYFKLSTEPLISLQETKW